MQYPEKLKLVIWDMDDTFWKGTLSEGEVEIIDKNIQLIKELTNRGIVNSISSKNNFDDVMGKLKEIGISEYFVFPKINWQPKGLQIQNIISEMALRDVNCIFIDDNILNLNEAKNFSKDLFVYLPEQITNVLLELPCSKGKDDSKHSRLKQYKILQNKVEAKSVSNISNIEFLKSCEINIDIDYDCDKYLGRILELIERTNQLNYTKLRLNNNKAIEEFKKRIKHYQTHAGVIKCSDKFGDYGVVGFFLVRKENDSTGVLEHFVFSCRIINMGVESYIYNKLGQPKFELKNPVAYPINEYYPVTWVSEGSNDNCDEKSNEVLLLGPCHLLQLSNFFDTELNFVQYLNGGSIIKYDCPAFFSPDQNKVISSSFIKNGLSWSMEDYEKFHNSIHSVDKIILSLEDLFVEQQYIYQNGLYFRYEGNNKLKYQIKTLDMNKRVSVFISFINYLLESKNNKCKIYILDSLINEKTPNNLVQARLVYSHLLHKHFSGSVFIVDMKYYDKSAGSTLGDGVHLNRKSYFDIYTSIVEGELPKSYFDYNKFESKYILLTRLILSAKRKFGVNSFIYKFGKFLYILPEKIKKYVLKSF